MSPAIWSVLGALVALLVADRVWTARQPVTPRLYLPHPRLGWTLRPGLRREIDLTRDGRVVWRHQIAINSRGFNDREWTAKRPGVTRVLVVGDSIVEARQVEREANFVAQAERRLNDGGRYELLNAGVAGWSVDSALNCFQQIGRTLEPDIVILGLFVGNDLLEGDYETFRYLFGYAWDCRRYDKPAFNLVSGTLVRSNFPAWRNVSARLFSVELYERSRAFRRAYQAANRVMERRRNGSRLLKSRGISYNAHMEQTKGSEFFYRQTEAQIDALAAECRQAGCRFGVMLEPNFPLFYPLAPDGDPVSPQALEYARDLVHYETMQRRLEPKYPVLSLIEPLHAAGTTTTFRPADPHLNQTGHQIVGDALARFVDQLDRPA
jgi:hypothetical protein